MRSRPDWPSCIPDAQIRTAMLADPEHGVREGTGRDRRPDVVGAHRARWVADEVVERVIGTCSAGWACWCCTPATSRRSSRDCWAPPARSGWRNDGERELVWTVDPAHPIAEGVPQPLIIGATGDVRRILRHPDPGRFESGFTYTSYRVGPAGCSWIQSSLRETVSSVRAAPTVIADGALPGDVIPAYPGWPVVGFLP